MKREESTERAGARMKLLNISCMCNGQENGFTKAMRSVCNEYEEISMSEPFLNQRIQAVVEANLVFIQIQATGISRESISWLKYINAFIVHWSGDVRQPLPDFYIEMASWGVDLTCFSNMEDVRTMRALGFRSEFLQIGYDPEIYKKEGAKGVAPEIVFMGNNCGGFPLSQYRKDMVQFLRKEYGSRFGLYGSGWGGLEDGSYMGDQHGEAAIYRGAKIGINLSHFDCERYTSDRMFRMMGTGICILSHNFKGAKEMFSGVGRWDDFEELKSLINWYFENENLRNSAAIYGYNLSYYEYTFNIMATNIIKLWKLYA